MATIKGEMHNFLWQRVLQKSTIAFIAANVTVSWPKWRFNDSYQMGIGNKKKQRGNIFIRKCHGLLL